MVYLMKANLVFPVALFCGVQMLYGLNNFTPDEKLESQLINSMLSEAYRGEWHKMANKTIPYDGFKMRGGKIFLEKEEKPYTGWYAQYDESNEPRLLCSYQDGIRHGFIYMWDATSIRRLQGEYHQNNRHGEFLEWNKHGTLISSKQYRSNKLHGESTFWYGSGKVRLESYFLYGHIIDAQGWYPDGTPCPFSRVINGKGLVLRYEENFTKGNPPTKSVLRSALEGTPDWQNQKEFIPLEENP